MKAVTNHFFIWPICCIFALATTACDDGRIGEADVETYEEGYSVRLVGTFSGTDRWTDGYSVVLAGFRDGSEYAVISKALPLYEAEVEMDLNGIGDEVDELKLCAVNRLRESVYDFCTWRTEGLDLQADTVRLLVDAPLDLGMYACLQQGVFDRTCVACHGAGERPAAGLSLLEGVSRRQLLEQPSTVVPGGIRVVPGDADGSVLYQMVATELSRGMGIDHSDMLAADGTELKLLKDWMDHGTDKE